MWKAAALIALATFASAKDDEKKIDGPVIGIDLGTGLHQSVASVDVKVLSRLSWFLEQGFGS